jgi:hypothetical protein
MIAAATPHRQGVVRQLIEDMRKTQEHDAPDDS